MAGLPLPQTAQKPRQILCMKDLEDAAAEKLSSSARGKLDADEGTIN